MPPVVLKVSAIPHVAPWRGVFGLGWSQIEENIRKRVWRREILPGKPKGGGNPGPPIGPPPWFNIGFEPAWPSAAYEDVIESMTDWAFSWPISTERPLEHPSERSGRTSGGSWGRAVRW